MLFRADDQQAMIQSGVRAFAEATLRPGAAARDQAGQIPRELMKKLWELGVFGLTVPEASGGLGLDHVAAVLCLEELAAADAGVALCVVQHQNIALGHLRAAGLTAQFAALASNLLFLGQRLVWAHGEGGLHGDAQRVTTRAERVDGGWRLAGEKPQVWGAPDADLAIVTAQTAEGLSAFWLDLRQEGVALAAAPATLGLCAAGAATIRLDGVQLPAAALLGAPGTAAGAVAAALQQARLGIAAVALGIAREALRLAGRYVQERQQFGKPIAQFQPVQWQIANSALELDAARLLVHRAAWAEDHGRHAEAATRMARLTAVETALRVTDRAIQLHGGYGYTRDFGVERLYRDAYTLDGLFGSCGMQRVELARLLSA